MSIIDREVTRSSSLDRPVGEVTTPKISNRTDDKEPISSTPKIERIESVTESSNNKVPSFSMASQNSLASKIGSTLVPRVSMKSKIYKAEHLYSMLGYRVRITHPPKKDKASETLVGKSGIVVAVLKRSKLLRLHLDDGREVDIKRWFLKVDNDIDIPVDIHLKATGLANLDL